MIIPVQRTTKKQQVAVLLLVATLLPRMLQAQEETNRDLLGPPDVDSYIQNLLNTARIEELKPDEVVATLMLAENAIVADLGSGPGVFTIPLARQVSRGVVYAVDVEPRQLDALRGRVIDAEVNNIVPVLAYSTTPHLPASHVALILVVDTYRHLEDRANYFRRLRSMLRPGGRLAILEYKPGELPVGPPIAQKLPEGHRAEELRVAGYSLLRTFDMHEYHDFEVWVPSTSF